MNTRGQFRHINVVFGTEKQLFKHVVKRAFTNYPAFKGAVQEKSLANTAIDK